MQAFLYNMATPPPHTHKHTLTDPHVTSTCIVFHYRSFSSYAPLSGCNSWGLAVPETKLYTAGGYSKLDRLQRGAQKMINGSN